MRSKPEKKEVNMAAKGLTHKCQKKTYYTT